MGLVVGMQRIQVARNWTVWGRFLGDWTNEIEERHAYFWTNEVEENCVDEDYNSCCSNEAVFGD